MRGLTVHDEARSNAAPFALILSCFIAATSSTRALGIELFGYGVDIPETISMAPLGYGDIGGHLVIPDPGPANSDGTVSTDNSNVWALPVSGGLPKDFLGVANLPGFTAGYRGGVFLPEEFAQVGGQFLVTGRSALTTFEADGTENIVFQPVDFDADLGFVPVRLTTPAVAPDAFGDLGGHVVVSYQKIGRFLHVRNGDGDLVDAVQLNLISQGGIISVSPSGVANHLVTPSVPIGHPDFLESVFEPFGLAFAPDNFGSYSNSLLVSDSVSRNIVAVEPDSSYELVGRVPFVGDEDGVRQITFSPSSFGVFGEHLFVSVAAGERNSGALYAMNENGQVVGKLQVPREVGHIDPRGLLFMDDGTLLVADAIGRILRVTQDDFFQAGDANRDYVFDQNDVIRILQGGKYLSGQPASWAEGDFNGDGLFDQQDIRSALTASSYRAGPYLAHTIGEATRDDIYSEAGIFTSDEVIQQNFAESGDEQNISIAAFGNAFGSLSLGNAAKKELSEAFLLSDLGEVGSVAGGGPHGDVDLVYVPIPEPSSAILMAFGFFALTMSRFMCHRAI